jgi:cytochrome b
VFGQDLGRIAVACSQLQRSLESLLEQAEHLTDNRLLWSEPNTAVPPLSEHDRSVLQEMHGLIADGLASLLSHLSAHTTPDTDETRAREI